MCVRLIPFLLLHVNYPRWYVHDLSTKMCGNHRCLATLLQNTVIPKSVKNGKNVKTTKKFHEIRNGNFFRQNAIFVLILVHNRGILTRKLKETHEIRNDYFFRQIATFVLILQHFDEITTK